MKEPVRATVFVMLGVASASVEAQDDWSSWPTAQRFHIEAGYFVPDLQTTIIVIDDQGNVGTSISFEQNLGLDDNKGTGLLSADWRFFKRHTVSYSFFELNRSSAAESSVAIAIGEEVFDITLPIQSFFDITANELSYSYSLLLDERKEFFVGLGLSVQNLSLGIQGTASSPDPGAIINEQLASTAPLPTLNFGFNYAFSEKWLFLSRIGWLAVEADLGADEELEGEIINANVGIEWRAFRNVGFFANYQLFDVDVDVTDDGTIFAVDYDYRGPVIGFSANF